MTKYTLNICGLTLEEVQLVLIASETAGLADDTEWTGEERAERVFLALANMPVTPAIMKVMTLMQLPEHTVLN